MYFTLTIRTCLLKGSFSTGGWGPSYHSNGEVLYTLYIEFLYMLNSNLNMFLNEAFSYNQVIFNSNLIDSHLGSQSPWLPLDPKNLLLRPLGVWVVHGHGIWWRASNSVMWFDHCHTLRKRWYVYDFYSILIWFYTLAWT